MPLTNAERQARFRARHALELREKRREEYRENREAILAARKRWREENPELHAERLARRRASRKKKGAAPTAKGGF